MRILIQYKIGLASLILTGWCCLAQAWTGEVSWPTFYRAGPGRNYTVLEELERGTTLEVMSCNDGWCRVRNGDSVGYTEQEWILRPDVMPKKFRTPDLKTCVESIVTGSGYKGGLAYAFCPQQTDISVPSGQVAPDSVHDDRP